MILATSISTEAAASVDEYFGQLPPAMRGMCAAVRKTIHAAAPGVKESIRYFVPTFEIGGSSIQLAAFDHYALLIVGEKISAGNAAVCFSPEKPLPEGMLEKIIASWCFEK